MKKYISYLLSIVIISLMIPGTIIHAAKVNGKTITSQGACVMDYETGEVLYEYNGYKKRVPASMTKIMNMYIIYESLASGKISLDKEVPISENVYNKSRNSGYPNALPLSYNETYTVNELMDVMVVYSASGACIAMAELISGSEEAYVKKMNNKAKEMGIDAVYYDSCGIKDNQITPVGMATLARNIIRDYPDILVRSSKKSVTFHGKKYETTNRLLDTQYYEGADGLKTGTTDAAGYCFCGTAVRNGKRMISVTMSSSSTSTRFTDTATLLDYGFSVSPTSKENVYFTDMSTFINGKEVPTFAYKGENDVNYAVVIAEDLANYGFDVNFNSNNKTLYLTYNENKPVNPIKIDYYKDKNDVLAYPVIGNDITVILNDGLKEYKLSNTHNLDGYVCFSVDEFGRMYDFLWANDIRSSKINVYSKKDQKEALDNNSLIYFTDISTYINGFEVPTFMFKGNNPHAVIVAEDLANYGFDIDFNNGLLYISYNENKSFSPIPIDYYKGKNDEQAFVISQNSFKVVLNDGLNDYTLNDIYNVNGYMCVSVDELSRMYDFTWDNNSRSSKINVYPKKTQEDVSAENNSTIYFTDISTYINGFEVPTFMFKGNNPHAVIIAEDLANYGFDVDFNNESKTLYIKHNPEKPITPIPMFYYRGKNGEKAYDIVPNSVNVILNDGTSDYQFTDIYNVDGYMCVSIDEFSKIYDFDWSDNLRAAKINITSKVKPSENKPVNNITSNSEPEYIYYTDISTFIDDMEVPTFIYKGNGEQAVIIADDLINYGFDTTYNNDTRTLYITHNKDKELNPVSVDNYKGKNGEIAYKIHNSDIKIVLNDYTFKNIYNINGYTCISVDEFKNIYDYTWSDENHTAYIVTANIQNNATSNTSYSEKEEDEENTYDIINIKIGENKEVKFENAQPYIENGIVMIPLIEFLENFEIEVERDSTTSETVISNDIVSLRIKPGSTSFKFETKNDKNEITRSVDYNFETAPITKNGTTFCPLIEILSQFDINCYYDEDNNQYIIENN